MVLPVGTGEISPVSLLVSLASHLIPHTSQLPNPLAANCLWTLVPARGWHAALSQPRQRKAAWLWLRGAAQMEKEGLFWS